jgi:hypothetical protein
MSVPTVDIKILWARAAGLCSMSDCRRVLTAQPIIRADLREKPRRPLNSNVGPLWRHVHDPLRAIP